MEEFLPNTWFHDQCFGKRAGKWLWQKLLQTEAQHQTIRRSYKTDFQQFIDSGSHQLCANDFFAPKRLN